MKKTVSMIMTCAMLFGAFAPTALATENLFGTNPEKTIIINEDCSDFAESRSAEGISMANLTSWADQYADTNVGAIFINTNAQRVNYGSNITENFWEGVDKSGSYWTGSRKAYYEFYETGKDMNTVRIDLLRERNISPWITIRMNDIHNANDATNPYNSTFRLQHSYQIGSKSVTTGPHLCFDYSIKAVRDYYFALIQENVERYDADGLELDWMRESYPIKDAALREETTQEINDLVRDVRKLLDLWEIRRGHEIKLAVRVPAQIHVAENYGLDAETWSRERLVDMVTITARWASTDTNMDIEGWETLLKETAGNPDILVGAGQEVLYRSNPNYTTQHQSADTARGTAYSYLSRSSDYTYLFNHMDRRTAISYAQTDYIPLLKQINSLENMDGVLRRHAVTFRDRWASDEAASYELPAIISGEISKEFRIHVGDIVETNDTEAFVILGVNQTYGAGAGVVDSAENVVVTVNGTACTYVGKVSGMRLPYPVGADGTVYDLIKYEIPTMALQDNWNTVKAISSDGIERELTWAEIMVDSVKPGTRNLAFGKEVMASSYYGNLANYAATKANDGIVDNLGWIPNDTETTPSWWQIDLNKSYEIGKIEIVARQEESQNWVGYRSNFKVEGSTTPDFADGTVFEFARTEAMDATVVPACGTWEITVPESIQDKVRYVRVIELNNDSTEATMPFLTEVRIYSR